MSKELADRCEAATGPDRELDLAIIFYVYGPDKDLKGSVLRGSFNPTASLDDAMTLVPAGWKIAGLFQRNCQLPNWIWKVELWHPEADMNVRGIARNADLPAPALCAAAFRARAS